MRQPEQQAAVIEQDQLLDISSLLCSSSNEELQLFEPLSELPEEISSDSNNAVNLQPTEPTLKARQRQCRQLSKSNICDVCGRSFSESYNLRIHKMTHTDERPHVCSVCGKGFRQQNKLRIHAVTHTNERPHICDICGKGYRFANYLAVHRRLHTGEKPYACTVAQCGYSFHSVHARRMHQKLQHPCSEALTASATDTSTLSYTCSLCGRVLSDQCYLNTHMKRHYNQRDFPCMHPQCGKRFFSSSELNHHQIAHTRLRTHCCRFCSARFLRKSNYKQHLKLHQQQA
ncbi:maker286 [Drosophila busckii]|uniref:Maker286 n=1 Tax=Drosophila busckii TaxID=30019 RepID=A0A0M4EUC2_DROBS|nr:gastrula zinc finger protein XlCGF7.1 [Drosophila busckii]ALC48660.1 maker286 [Drosophila busckii]